MVLRVVFSVTSQCSHFVQMILDLGARLGGNGVVDQVVENCQKLSAGHFSTPFFLRRRGAVFLRK